MIACLVKEPGGLCKQSVRHRAARIGRGKGEQGREQGSEGGRRNSVRRRGWAKGGAAPAMFAGKGGVEKTLEGR